MTVGTVESPDVIVVGAGAAGLVAAATAASEGATVVLLERGPVAGGTAIHSIGEFWIPNNRHLQACGIADPRAECLRFMAQLSYPDAFQPEHPSLGLADAQYELLTTFYDEAARAVEHLEAIGAMRSRFSPAAYGDALGHPEYHAERADNLVPQGRHLIVDDGDPAFGPRGEAYVHQLVTYLEKHSVDIRVGHRVVEVFSGSDGHVEGVVVEAEEGLMSLRARRAVVFATGGFGHDPAACATYLPAPIDAVAAVSTNTGDFLRIGMSLGAALGNMTNAYLGNAAFELGIGAPRIPQLTHFPFGDSMIWVDCTGNRVVNEKAVFTERAQAHFWWDAERSRHSRRVLIQVFDRTVREHPAARYPMPGADVGDAHVLSAPTWRELAEAVDARLAELVPRTGGIRLEPNFAANLERSVARFDEDARSGVDRDFGRGATAIQTCYEPRLHEGTPNVTMAPFATDGPYYAMIIGAAMFDTAGGPVINSRAEVIDVLGQPIPGLYGAGCCVASPGGRAYWSGGAPIGLALTFGYIAGRNAARG
ncbi:MAG: Fumarate reductase/succinate dehydrogenase flavoprotein domain protein [Pseudonocardiales bacterium]|nr:Fumarate reductase/succinate dehydrogenase flavoprotein domain protein [Pseudonocardiales bacterium]